MKLTKKFRKMAAVLLTTLMVVMVLMAVPFTASAAEDTDNTADTVYPGGQITVTYSFAKDIPAGCAYYYFETKYPLEMVKYSGFKNHWALQPRIDEVSIYYDKIVPIQGMTTDGSHYGPQVKAGQKIISIIYDVIKKAKVSDLKFPIVELELGINNQYEYLRDLSYLSYDVAITSKGEKPIEPTTVAPTTAEPTTVAPTTEEPTTEEPTEAPTTEAPTTVEPTTVEPTTVEPTEAPTTVEPTETPTTEEPTTVPPTTVEPTTVEPTTVEPTTAKLKTVKGTVKSYLSESDTVTIQLIKSGEVAYETTVKGNNAKYSISGVASGTYTMKVSKNAHADREYTVIVANSDVIRNAKIFAIGDVNSDGDISVVDATLVQKYIVGLENLKDFQKKSADVNDNNEITVVDATLIQKYIVGLDNFV